MHILFCMLIGYGLGSLSYDIYRWIQIFVTHRRRKEQNERYEDMHDTIMLRIAELNKRSKKEKKQCT